MWSLGAKILGSFLLPGLVLVAVGAMNLNSLSDLHARSSAVNSRDLQPLTTLRQAQNSSHGHVISGFAAAQTDNPAAQKAMTEAAAEYAEQTEQALARLVKIVPPELRGQTEDLVATYTSFKAADLAFKEGARGPNAKVLEEKASGLYGTVETKFEALAQAFLKDAGAQEAAVRSEYDQARLVTGLLVLVGLAAGAALGLGIRRSVRQRTSTMLDVLGKMAQGGPPAPTWSRTPSTPSPPAPASLPARSGRSPPAPRRQPGLPGRRWRRWS